MDAQPPRSSVKALYWFVGLVSLWPVAAVLDKVLGWAVRKVPMLGNVGFLVGEDNRLMTAAVAAVAMLVAGYLWGRRSSQRLFSAAVGMGGFTVVVLLVLVVLVIRVIIGGLWLH